MKEYQWKNRLLIINVESNLYEKSDIVFEDYLSDPEALDERKLLVITARDESFEILNSQKNSLLRVVDDVWQDRLVEDKRQMWLIGLDGGVKKIWDSVPSPSEVFDIIDAMPMRLSELKKF